MSFEGFPVAALDFYDDLEMDNTKSFWEANKAVYKDSVEAPMKALATLVEPEFGSLKIFRPYRDVRFAKDKTPYKTHRGAFVGVAPATGWYVEVSARGVRTGAGFYEADGARLAAFRDAIVSDLSGPQLKRILAKIEKAGFEVSGEQLKTAPRGYDKEHPAHRAAAAQAALRRADDRVRAGRPHGVARRRHPRRLANPQAARRLARPARPRLTRVTDQSGGPQQN
ncbi:DUF2461 domain-containing protein [Nocardioides sp. B-3]|uniref:DUF2461 domain-containing protein n=1 Tax=Nocardioides sp. B-3 TaxID=2895565 RepID=UPI0021538D35|nr:DUF2461 domain-containing protein [Nocardioides sp. B-3]UUZ61344.1 DUF2461 domain-containing protein [Nocardioides sp. B-3]